MAEQHDLAAAQQPWLPASRHDYAGRDLLTTGSYNIHRCVGMDTRYDVDRVARVIRELRCDTVGLQEVDMSPDGPARHLPRRARVSKWLDSRRGLQADSPQLDLLARATGMQSIAGPALLPHSSVHCNALLTTREFGMVRRYDLTVAGREPRGALDVELCAAGQVVRVIVTHLGLRPAERRMQVKQLLTVLRGIPPDHPVVVLGDINEWLPIGRPLRWIHRLLGRPPSQRSFPVWAPIFALDRVWTRPAGALLALEVHRSPDARAASDHFPVRAVVAPDVGRRGYRRVGQP
jgi:endonuclease/exonuclease/phosphatase family metal-dependent hydrolase